MMLMIQQVNNEEHATEILHLIYTEMLAKKCIV